MQRLSEILKDMKAKSSAEAVVLTSSDGLVLDAVQDEGLDLESLAAYAATNVTASERIGESVHCGAPESVIIIYQGKALVMAPLGPVVAMLLGTGAQIGNLRLQLKRSMADLSTALEEELDLSLAPAARPAAPPVQPAVTPAEPASAAEPESAPVAEPSPKAPPVDPPLVESGRRAFRSTLQGSSVNLR